MQTFPFGFSQEQLSFADYLDKTSFDEKFEIELATDRIENIYHIDNKYHVPVLAGGYRRMYEYASAHLIHPADRNYDDIMQPEKLQQHIADPQQDGTIQLDVRQKLVDGTYRWVQYLGITGEDKGVPAGIIYFYVYDIQNQKDRLEGDTPRRREAVMRDALTGLRMRDDFVSAASALVATEDIDWCCLAIDVRHFKIFNAWYGYEMGDYLLSDIGGYLLDIERAGRAVSVYFGRDNFAVVMPFDKERINEICSRLQEKVSSYSTIVGFFAVAGVCVLEKGAKLDMGLYDKAKLASGEAKNDYVNRVRYYDPSRFMRTRENYEMLTDFREALANDVIEFYLQPQCDLSSGKIVGVEALARWTREDGTVVSPGTFIPPLEMTGFITELDKYIWERVCRWIRGRLDAGALLVPVSVNVSNADLLSMDVPTYLTELVARHGVPASMLKVEITESAYAENFEVVNEAILALMANGFSVYLDDFGSGYSSLSMLDRVNVSLLKLDMAFMRGTSALTKKGTSIVESILGMTKVLELPVVVEGVETADQVALLNGMGCRYAQGFYFYRPMPVADFEQLLEKPDIIDAMGIQGRTTDLFQARELLSENNFTGTMLNHILGPVAYYSLENGDLNIERFNEPFRRAIGDDKMDSRVTSIQNYVPVADHPVLYAALESAERHDPDGGNCEIRFFKSDGGAFWFRMQFFFVREEGDRKLFFGQVEDITEFREQSLHFLEVLRKQSDVTMRLDLDKNVIQYITGGTTLYRIDPPSVDLGVSISQTAENRIPSEADRKAFIDFFNPDRLRDAYRRAVYHEVLNIDFKLSQDVVPVEFSTYYIRHSKSQSLTVYAFVRTRDRVLLKFDPLTGMKNRYAYNETLEFLEAHPDENANVVAFSMDVNGLKNANDQYGHIAGDELLRVAGEGIMRVFSPHGSCYRIGGDEFVALVYGTEALAVSLKEELDQVLANWEGNLVDVVTVSTGYASMEKHPALSVRELMKMADLEMFRAKSRYYSQIGVDRRMQQAAFNALCNSYTKILRISLTEDRFEILQAQEDELAPESGYREGLSEWLHGFAAAGRIHPMDKERYLQQIDMDNLRNCLKQNDGRFALRYRRYFEGAFREAMLEIIAAPGYTDDDQKAFLYVKVIGG